MNTVLCSEYSVCVQFILRIQYRHCVPSTVYSSLLLNKESEIYLSAQVLQKAKLVESGC